MPATARLLQKLQETLGDELAHDLILWVDEARSMNRAEVREIADLYLARLDERLERRLAEVKAELKAELKAGLGELRVEMADRHRDLLRWLFVFWAGTLVPLAGLFVALGKL